MTRTQPTLPAATQKHAWLLGALALLALSCIVFACMAGSVRLGPGELADGAAALLRGERASMAATLLRHHSTSAVQVLQAQQGGPVQPVIQSQPLQPSEQRWIHRLKELERRLKAEREARLLDRSGARKRIEEGRAENEELRMMLEREKERRVSLEFGGEDEDGRGRRR